MAIPPSEVVIEIRIVLAVIVVEESHPGGVTEVIVVLIYEYGVSLGIGPVARYELDDVVADGVMHEGVMAHDGVDADDIVPVVLVHINIERVRWEQRAAGFRCRDLFLHLVGLLWHKVHVILCQQCEWEQSHP